MSDCGGFKRQEQQIGSPSSSSSYMDNSPDKTRTRRWQRAHHHGRTGATALVIAASLFIATVAWTCLVFSGTTSRCLSRLLLSPPALRHLDDITLLGPAASQYDGAPSLSSDKLKLEEIVFGIAGSSQLWERRKEFVRLWWRPREMRGHVWLEEAVQLSPDDAASLPPVMVSEDTSRFRYTNPTGHPSGLRIARVLLESFRATTSARPRWFVLGDDDTIFNVDNLVGVLGKYDPGEMVYVGAPSESHSANAYFSHNMAYGGGGVAISYPLAAALVPILDLCIDRYHVLYGSDDRLHACISELGIPLSREPGFHQWDIRGSAHGLLMAHPVAPFVSIHHVEAVDPLYPGLSSLDSLKLFTKAMHADPPGFLQRAICYDRPRHLSFSVSVGYAVQVFPSLIPPRTLDRSELTFSAWNRISTLNEFDLDMRETPNSVCKRPVLFFLKDFQRQGNLTSGSYERSASKDDLRKKVFCFPHSSPLPYVKNIRVVAHPLQSTWHLAPRRMCCRLNQTSGEDLAINVEQCQPGSRGAFSDSL